MTIDRDSGIALPDNEARCNPAGVCSQSFHCASAGTAANARHVDVEHGHANPCQWFVPALSAGDRIPTQAAPCRRAAASTEDMAGQFRG